MGRHTSNETRARLVDMVFGHKYDLKVAAAALALKYKTAYNILSVFRDQKRIDKQPSSGRPKRFDEKFCLAIVNYFTNERPDGTLQQCRQYLCDKREELSLGEKMPSITTFNRILAQNKISLKALTIVLEQRNSETTMTLRRQYAIKYTRFEGTASFFIIDEFGCNVSMRRGKGRSKIGTPALIEAHGTRGNNLSICAAIDKDGPVHFYAEYLAFNRFHFVTFLEDLAKKLKEKDSNKQYVLVMDNVAFHKTEEVRAFIREHKVKVLYLPPWSPMLNPIENCFSKVKNLIIQQYSTSSSGLMQPVELSGHTNRLLKLVQPCKPILRPVSN